MKRNAVSSEESQDGLGIRIRRSPFRNVPGGVNWCGRFIRYFDREIPMPRLLFACLFGLSLAVVSPALAGKYNDVLSVGDKVPAFDPLPAVDGTKKSLADFDAKVLIVVFTCNSCPIAQDYEDRIVAFSEQHKGDVAIVAINPNKVPDDSLEKMKQRAEEKKFPFAYLQDETQAVAKSFGAYATPEFYVLSPERKIVYMGAMDDSSEPTRVKKQYLEPAVAAALAGKTPETTETYAHGCRIRYEKKRRTEE
jgi:peroxiredoxin